MNKISELKKILNKNLQWNKKRIDCFVRAAIGLLKVRTVNLSEIAVGFPAKTKVKTESRYRRLQRFFSEFKIDYEVLAQWIFKLFATKSKIYLTIDRTNWFWGKTKINLLTLGIAHEGVAILILWELLDKSGNAKATEHKAILEHFVKLFGKECIEGVLADREFMSGEFLDWLIKNDIPFYIRIKGNTIVKIKGKDICKAEEIFSYLNPKKAGLYHMAVEISGQKVYLAGSRSERGELMIVATNRQPKNAIAIYLRRWEIEVLFSCLKTHGFRFEDTHLTNLERIKKLMALLAVGLCWAHKIGEWRAGKKPIRFAKHGKELRPQHSFFRYGFDFIREILLSPFKRKPEFKACIKLLMPITLQPEACL